MDFKINSVLQKNDCTGYDNNTLPTNVLSDIFRRCSAQTLSNCSLVCKRWNQISSRNNVWENLFKAQFPYAYQNFEHGNHINYFKAAFGFYFSYDNSLRKKEFYNSCLEGSREICLKHCKGTPFPVVHPNTVRVYDGKIYYVDGGSIKIIDGRDKHQIELNNIIDAKGKFLLSMSIDKSKGHLYLRLYDPLLKHCITIINMKDWTKLKCFVAGKEDYVGKKSSYTMRIHGKWLIAASHTMLRIWNIEEDHKLIKESRESIESFKLHDNKLFYSVCGRIAIWDLEKSENCHYDFFQLGNGPVKCMQMHEGKLFAGYAPHEGRDSSVIIWDLETHGKIAQFHEEGELTSMLYDGKKFLTATKVGEAKTMLNTRYFGPRRVFSGSEPIVKNSVPLEIDYTGYHNHTLPKNMLTSIFKYCDSQTLRKCSFVCKRWNQISSLNNLWEGLFKTKFPCTYQNFFRQHENIKSFKYNFGCFSILNNKLRKKQFSNECTKIFRQPACLKYYNDKPMQIFQDPNTVSIYERKKFVGQDRGVKIIDDVGTHEIEIENLNENERKFVSMIIDESKGHLYMRFYDEADVENDCIKIIDMKNWKILKDFEVMEEEYDHAQRENWNESYSMQIHGKWLAAASCSSLRIWNKEENHKLIYDFDVDDPIVSFKLHNNKVFYSCGKNIFVWDLEKDQECLSFTQSEDIPLTCIQIYDGQLWAGYTVKNEMLSKSKVIVWDLETHEKIGQFQDDGYLTSMLYCGTQLFTTTTMDGENVLHTRNFYSKSHVVTVPKNKALEQDVTEKALEQNGSKKRKREIENENKNPQL